MQKGQGSETDWQAPYWGREEEVIRRGQVGSLTSPIAPLSHPSLGARWVLAVQGRASRSPDLSDPICQRCPRWPRQVCVGNLGRSSPGQPAREVGTEDGSGWEVHGLITRFSLSLSQTWRGSAVTHQASLHGFLGGLDEVGEGPCSGSRLHKHQLGAPDKTADHGARIQSLWIGWCPWGGPER